MSRKTARKHILNIVFQAEFDVDVAIEQIMNTYDEEYKTTADVSDAGVDEEKLLEMDEDKISRLRTIHNNDKKFIINEAKGIVVHKAHIDELIAAGLDNWEIDRLSKVDLSILRIAVYEIVYADDIPNAVAANEAVQLAKQFSEDKAPGFINGVLGKIIDLTEKG